MPQTEDIVPGPAVWCPMELVWLDVMTQELEPPVGLLLGGQRFVGPFHCITVLGVRSIRPRLDNTHQ